MSTVQSTIDVICPPQRGILTCLTRANTAGLSIAVAASLLSLGSILYAFSFMYASSGFHIFHNSMDVLVFALLFADFVQAVGGLLSVKWIGDGRVQTGSFCEAQGVLQTLGETGVALTTLLIAVYTFVGVATGNGLKSRMIPLIIVLCIWSFIGILLGAGHGATRDQGPYMVPVPFWCWVGSSMTWKVFAEYLWMWLALFASCLLYIPLFLWMRGILIFDEARWYVWSFQWTLADGNVRLVRRKALVMLLYPIVYCFCILPLSFVRMITFKEEATHGTTSMPPVATFVVITIFSLSGFLNVILVMTTKPNLGLFGRHEEPASGRPPSRSAINQSRPEMASEIDLAELARLPSLAGPSRRQ